MADADGVLIHNPGHDLGVGAHIRCRHVFVGAEKREDLRHVSTGHPFEFAHTEQFWIQCNTAFGAAKGQIHKRGLERHGCSKRNSFIATYRRMVTNPTLAWPTSDVVLHPPASESHARAVVEANRNGNFKYASWCDQIFNDAIFELQPLASVAHP